MHRTQRATANAWLAFAGVLLLSALPSAALAQPADKMLHVGILSSGVLENRSPLDQAFVQGLRDQGYLEGKNLIIERRYNSSKLKDNAHELAGMKLDAILTTYRATAAYIDKIKKSANPANLPVEQPTRFELVINMKTAKALGLSVPRSLLMRADNVIQ